MNILIVWMYLLYVGGWVGGLMCLEYVVLVLVMVFLLLGMVLFMLGIGWLYVFSLWGCWVIMFLVGVLVYIVVLLVCDFVIFGLESGLVLVYLGLLWWMMVCWL